MNATKRCLQVKQQLSLAQRHRKPAGFTRKREGAKSRRSRTTRRTLCGKENGPKLIGKPRGRFVRGAELILVPAFPLRGFAPARESVREAPRSKVARKVQGYSAVPL